MEIIIDDVKIRKYGYALNNKITSVIINNAESIGDCAFLGCKKLKSVIIKSNLKIIGKGAFKSCENITKLVLPNTIEKIDDDAFASASFTIELPDCDYGKSVFKKCRILDDIVLPKSMKKVPARMFDHCNLINLNCSNVEIIEEEAFSNCENLQNVIFGNSIKKIGNSAFAYCNLSKIDFPDTIKTIGEGAFTYNGSIKEIIIPNSVSEIGNYAFVDCNNVKNIRFPKNFENIPKFCIEASNIKEIIWPVNLKDAGIGTMSYAKSYNNFDFPFLDFIPEKFFISCELDSVCIPNTVKCIKREAFYNSKIRALFLPRSIEYIEEGAFDEFVGNIYFAGNKEEFKKIANSNSLDDIRDVNILKNIDEILNEGYSFKEAQNIFSGLENNYDETLYKRMY